MNLKSKFLGLISAGSIVLSSVVSLLSFSADSSLTADIIQKTRYQEQFTSNSENKSAYSQNCEKLSLKDVGYIYNWYSDTLGQVNDILQNAGTVPSAYNLPSRTYELNSAKVFIEYPNSKSETITLSWFLCSGPSGYSEQFSEINMGDSVIRPNSIQIKRAFNNGESHTIQLLTDSLDVYIYSSSGYRFNTNQTFSTLGSDGSLVDPVKYSVNPNIQCRTPDNKNNVNRNLYPYDYTNYEYRLLDENNNVVDYPTDYQIIQGYIKINYKHNSSANWNLNNYNQRRADIFYMSCFYNNREKSAIENQQFYTVTNQYPGMKIYNISSPNYNNTNFFDSPHLTYNNDTNQYSLDFDSLLDDLKLQLPDVDAYLKPTFDFQPSLDGEFKMPLDFNYNDLFDDIVFNPPDVPGGGGGGGGGTITPWQPPEFPEHTTSFIISAPVTTFTTDYLNADVDEEIIDMSKEIVTYGYNIWVGAGLISVVIFLTGFALVWRFTGGEK